MARDVNDHDFISRLLVADTLPWLNDGELVKLRAYLAAPIPLSATYSGPISHTHWWKLKTILSFNENLQVQGDMSGTCSDAQTLLDFAKEAGALTAAIDALHDQRYDSDDSALYGAHELVISSAWSLCKKVDMLRDTVNRQGMLSGDRKGALANLSRSLDFIAHVLRSSLANNWGYRITEDCAPLEVVKEWHDHWHTIRHTVINIQHWAACMVDTVISPQPANPAGVNDSKSSTDWRDVKRRLERLRDAGDAYTSQMKLAKLMGCSQPTVQKAISSSTKLKAWMATRRKAVIPAKSLSEIITDKTPQITEADPASRLTSEEEEVIMAKLIDQASPAERATMNAMNDAERRALVETCHAQQMDDFEGRRVPRQHKRV